MLQPILERKPTILWADDDPTVFSSIANIFREKGFDITTADNEDELLHLFREEVFDVIFIDLNWSPYPNFDYRGFELAEIMREINDTPRVVAVSANIKRPKYEDKITKFGFDAVLGKNDINFESEDFQLLTESIYDLAIITRLKNGEFGDLLEMKSEVYSQFSSRVKSDIVKMINEEHIHWISEKLESSAWILVCNREIMERGYEYLTPQKKAELQRRRKQIEREKGFPTFYFVKAPDIESLSTSPWRTVKKNDYYPTLDLRIKDGEIGFHVVGDFDTGADRTHLSDELLSIDNVVVDPQRGFFKKPYTYYEKIANVGFQGNPKDPVPSREIVVCVVEKWNASGFVEGHTNRQALMGRDIMAHFPDCCFCLCWRDRKTAIEPRR